MSKNKSFFMRNFFKNGYLFFALLLSALFATALVTIFDYNVLGNLKTENNKLFLFFAIAAGCITFFILLYVISYLKKKKITVADSVIFSLIISSVLYFVYTFISQGGFNIARAIVSIAVFIISIVFLIIRITLFKNNDKERKISYKKNTLFAYYSTINQKYDFAFAILTTIIFTLIGYVLLSGRYNTAFTTKDYILGAIVLVAFILYSATNSSSKYITSFDLFITGCLFSIPILVFYTLYIEGYNEKHLIYLAAILALILFFMLIKFMSFNLNAKEKEVQRSSCKTSLGYYLKKVFSSYGFTFILFIGMAIAFLILTFLDKGLITRIADVINGVESISADTLILLIISLIAVIPILLTFIFAISGLKNSKVSMGDALILISLVADLFGIVMILLNFNEYYLIGFAAYLLFSATVLASRVNNLV